MSQALWMRLREVDWSEYQTSQGTADRVPRLLQDISSRKISRAIKSSHMLWKLLCTDGIHPAAEPTIPFLTDLLENVTADVKFEIFDIFKSCATSLSAIDDQQPWHQSTTTALILALPLLKQIHKRGSTDIRISVEPLLETLEAFTNEK